MEAAERSLCEFRQGALLLKAVFFFYSHIYQSLQMSNQLVLYFYKEKCCAVSHHHFINLSARWQLPPSGVRFTYIHFLNMQYFNQMAAASKFHSLE